ncbi:hypothetical protein PFISCL1PPCAC_18326, partial [Pristionchus fissidentatus]
RRMLLLLIYLLVFLAPTTTLLVQCKGNKKNANGQTARSGASPSGAQKQSAQDDGARTAIDLTSKRGGLGVPSPSDPGNAGRNKSTRISIHGTIHNSDTTAEQVEGDARAPSVETPDHINMDKAAPGKVQVDRTIEKIEKTVEKVEPTQEVSKEQKEISKEQKAKMDATQSARDKSKSEENRVDPTQNTTSVNKPVDAAV